jgi:hypothetical protein
VAHGIVLRQHVQVRAQFGVVELVEIGQEMGAGVERIGHGAGRIQLGAVAGRQDGRFVGTAVVDAFEPRRAAITACPIWSGANASCSRSETGAVV